MSKNCEVPPNVLGGLFEEGNAAVLWKLCRPRDPQVRQYPRTKQHEEGNRNISHLQSLRHP